MKTYIETHFVEDLTWVDMNRVIYKAYSRMQSQKISY